MLDLATANRFSEHVLPEALNGIWNGMVELGYTSALVGCFLALNRRVLFTPEKLGKSQLEGNVILLLIMTICTTSYIVEAGENPHPTWEMIGAWVADTFAPSQATINAHIGRTWLLSVHSCSSFRFRSTCIWSWHFQTLHFTTQSQWQMRPLATDESGSAISLEELDLESLVQPITN